MININETFSDILPLKKRRMFFFVKKLENATSERHFESLEIDIVGHLNYPRE